jgi:hypothetical protein
MSESWALQKIIFARLTTFAPLQALIAARIYDAPKRDSVAFPYVSFGPCDITIDDADCIDGREEALQIDCWSRREGGQKQVKQIADAVKKALHEWQAEPDVGALVSMRVIKIRVFNDPDGITTHGVVTVSAMIEE